MDRRHREDVYRVYSNQAWLVSDTAANLSWKANAFASVHGPFHAETHHGLLALATRLRLSGTIVARRQSTKDEVQYTG